MSTKILALSIECQYRVLVNCHLICTDHNLLCAKGIYMIQLQLQSNGLFLKILEGFTFLLDSEPHAVDSGFQVLYSSLC